jgi:hypothetical protein
MSNIGGQTNHTATSRVQTAARLTLNATKPSNGVVVSTIIFKQPAAYCALVLAS